MSAIPHEKLDRIIQRFATVEHDMSSGAVSGDAFVRLSKEYADLEPTARKAQDLRKAYDEHRDLAEMVKAGGARTSRDQRRPKTLKAIGAIDASVACAQPDETNSDCGASSAAPSVPRSVSRQASDSCRIRSSSTSGMTRGAYDHPISSALRASAVVGVVALR